jgi:PAS domain-containing protein
MTDNTGEFEDRAEELAAARREIAAHRAIVDNSPDFILRYDQEQRIRCPPVLRT